MYYTGIEPFSKKPVNTAKNLNDRRLQRALMQFFKPENDFELSEALIKAIRADLIAGCWVLIPANRRGIRLRPVGSARTRPFGATITIQSLIPRPVRNLVSARRRRWSRTRGIGRDGRPISGRRGEIHTAVRTLDSSE